MSETTDLLRMDYINSLPQPFCMRQWGDKDWWWMIHDIDVGTGLIRIDVMGLLQIMTISECAEIRDCDGVLHNPDTFYSDWLDHSAPTPSDQNERIAS